MMYTRERLMKAVREAGRDGQPFTLGEVRATLGLKTQDKRELKRFRSRFRECSQILGDNLEKLGPNTFRLNGVQPSHSVTALKPIRPTALRDAKSPGVRSAQPATAVKNLADRVGVGRGSSPLAIPETPADPRDPDALKRRPREPVSFVPADQPGAAKTPQAPSFGERLSSWFGRSRTPNTSAASTALSRLAVDLQPKASNFEYRWIDGKLQVQRAADK